MARRHPILILGGIPSQDAAREVCGQGLTPVLHDARPIPWLVAAVGSDPLPVQVEVDTGMHRMGVPAAGAAALLAQLRETPALRLEGLYTHLARADEPGLDPSLRQLERFREIIAQACRAGSAPALIHFANSAALLTGAPLFDRLPGVNASRPGVMLYGVTPAPHLAAGLAPVMQLRTRVAALRDVARGEAVGYAALFRARTRTRVATLPLGYADGIPIALSNRGSVRIRGRRCPIVGRVSMDFVTVELPRDAAVALGDAAVFFGASGCAVEETAKAADTIPYELLVRVGTRVPRVYVGGN